VSKRDDQVLEVMGDHDLSTYAIAWMVKDRKSVGDAALQQMREHLEDMERRGLLEQRQDTVAEYRTLWRKL